VKVGKGTKRVREGTLRKVGAGRYERGDAFFQT
jgi:hypothetical protein